METQIKEETKELEKLYAETLHKIERGGITQGKIISVKNDVVVVDVGYKSEGVIPIAEFTEDELSGLKEGDNVEVFVERINDQEGVVILSRDRASRIRTWEMLTEAYSNNIRVNGTVVEKTKGGFFVDIKGIKTFLPFSQVDIKMVKDMDSYIGQNITVKILKMTPSKGYFNNQSSVIVSRRAVLEEDRHVKKQETLKFLKEGALLKGIVKNITDYGVFVDLGGIDGLLHISDISWRRVNHPSEFFSIGDEKEFIVLKYDEGTEKITLGYKQKMPDPWISAEEKYKPGMKIKGRVVNITDYGVFVEIEEGLEGLVHISELDWSPRPKHPSKYVSIGDEIEAVVISVNKEERKLSLTIRQLKPRPWDIVGQNYKVGQKIIGKVKTITDFGVFIRLPEGVDGLIHISDLSWTRHIKHPSEVLKKGQKVEAIILSLEPDKERMALGIKQLTPDPWQSEIPARFRLGDEYKGKVLRITDFGIFVELEGGVEGLVYSSEVNTSSEIKEGDEIWVRIIKMNTEERKIGLSMKNIKAATSSE
ncbi:30S ribosomal protein S1 [Dissulfurispira thermophila]|uniref:Small ribosomal subunit protein bS1 n=2 Tax=root TaxID=1 RepID=A0A7G1GZS9_9BACT|nr:30S ribosomal protein S1 [Dissulfurispira thermophila]BCB95391.1 30S ribosomal protein S1 [Dissulfurispira thermophila]